MKQKRHLLVILWTFGLLPFVSLRGEEIFPSAILSFHERGASVKGQGETVSDILFAELAANPDFYLVEREDLQKAMSEQELSMTGLVKPGEAVRIGQLTGARILITGSVIDAGDHRYLVAKIIGTETSRVHGAMVKGAADQSIAVLAQKLAGEVAETVKKRAAELMPAPEPREDRVAALRKAAGAGKKPTLFVKIEERHLQSETIDPAAETELHLLAQAVGFELTDDATRADVRLRGEAFTEFAYRRHQLVGVKARVEVKAVDRDGRIVAVDRQTAVAVDLTEHVAAKTALQEAAAKLAERLLVKVAALED